MHSFLRVIVMTLVSLTSIGFGADAHGQNLQFDVTDHRREIVAAIDATLVLRVVRVQHERVQHFGWEVQIAERTVQDRGRNLLRPDTFSGGPHPSDVLAWLSRDRRFPDDRRLMVSGYPYEIRIRLFDCQTEQIGDQVGFVSGTIEVSWRRLDVSKLSPFTALWATAR